MTTSRGSKGLAQVEVVLQSESSLLLLFEQSISQQVLHEVMHVTAAIEQTLGDVLIDMVPSYASIQITFDRHKIQALAFKSEVEQTLAGLLEAGLSGKSASIKQHANPKTRIDIPVYYGEEVALDITALAAHAKISVAEVIKRHSSRTYDVFATGFAPGFAYLGIVDASIAMPRQSTPRSKVRAGSVGIADQQTAIYPADSPGGWQIIGRTPLSMVDYASEQITRFSTGDQIQFVPMSKAAFLAQGGVLD